MAKSKYTLEFRKMVSLKYINGEVSSYALSNVHDIPLEYGHGDMTNNVMKLFSQSVRKWIKLYNVNRELKASIK